MVKITALLVLKCNQDGSDPVTLANAADPTCFGFLTVKEFIVFASRTIAKRSLPSQRLSVKHQGYVVHLYYRDGLCALGFMDDRYPVRSAFSLLSEVLDEYEKKFGDSWKTIRADSTEQWLYLSEALERFQDPAEADGLLKIQRSLDETKIILHRTIDAVLERGEKLDNLVEKSRDPSKVSRIILKQAKKTNQYCTIL